MNKRRKSGRCGHETTITTITAGLARQVCETCGRVRIEYVEFAVQIYPTSPRPALRTVPVRDRVGTTPPNRRVCKLCSQPATFLIPGGTMCEEHAWQAAARTSWDAADPWIPIRIDESVH